MLGEDSNIHQTQGGAVMTDSAGASQKLPNDIEGARLARAVENLNILPRESQKESLIVQGQAKYKQTINEEDLSLRNMIPAISSVLEINPEQAQKLLVEQNVPLGDLAVARFISERNGASPSAVLKNNPGGDWARTLRRLKVPVTDATKYINEVYNEVAFLRLDLMSR